MKEDHLDLWMYHGLELPFFNSYDDDWQYMYKECWKTKILQPSKTLVDLIAGTIREENKKADYLLYRVKKNFLETRNGRASKHFVLSKKPKLMREVVDQQLSNLMANIQNCETNQFSVRSFESKEHEEAYRILKEKEIG